MHLTLTANAALDRVIFIDEFAPATTMRAPRFIECAGGKGFDTSVALRGLQQSTTAIGFVAGYYGNLLVNVLTQYGIDVDPVWLPGETRLANVLVETLRARHSHVMIGALPVSAAGIEILLERFRTHLPQALWVVGAGSLPPGMPTSFYHTVATLAHAAGKPVLIDATGAPLLEALAAMPEVVKLNQDEFVDTFGLSGGELPAIVTAARQVQQERDLPAIVLTCGREGVLVVESNGVVQAQAPVQRAVNAAGAGDAASAAIVWRRGLGDGWAETVRWAAAVSAASVMTEATAEVRLADAEQLLPAVRLIQWA
ncbi:MAG: hexose kinase [Caldilineaceae bacterium]|jgi:1-phosphofructokinase family hexose kinase|nr:hexose kinase [Caldilineaceae bacterium]